MENTVRLPKFDPTLIPPYRAEHLSGRIFRAILKDKRDPKIREEYERFRIEYEAKKGGTK